MEQRIQVTHVNGAWRLEVCGAAEPLLFLTGGRAEAAACRLARSLATHGMDTRVEIRDRQNLLVGAHCYFGDEGLN